MTIDFVAGLHAYDHGGPLWCVLSKDYFLTICFLVSFFFFFVSLLLVPVQVALGISFPFVIFRHEGVACLLAGVYVMVAVWGPG